MVSSSWQPLVNGVPYFDGSSAGLANRSWDNEVSLPPQYAQASAPAVVPVAAAPPAPPHLQFTSNLIGTTTILSYGRARLPGQIIWAAGIDASSDSVTTSLLSFCAAYCEPIDSFENNRIQRMWCNGTLFFDHDQGGVKNVSILSEDDQFALNYCISRMEFHDGRPGATPSKIMEGFLGVGNVPAYRGLRILVFPDFPLVLANNNVPNISVQFNMIDETLLDVSVVLSKLIDHYMQRVGLQSTDSTAPGYLTYEIDGIDDQVYGLNVSDQSTLLDKLVQYRNVYKYQITDGRPIKLIRRPVNTDLVIDYPGLTESDLIRNNGSASVNFSRMNPVDLPAGLDLQYLDIDNNFDSSTAQSRHEGSGISNTVASLSSDFIIDNVTARKLSFDILYKNRTEGLTLTFEMDDLTPEVSDVIEITTDNGDTFICRVESQTQTKTRSSGISALNLLTVAGSDINGDVYRDGGASSKKYWPEYSVDTDFTISADGVVYGVFPNFSDGPVFTRYQLDGLNGRRLVSPVNGWRSMSLTDPLGANWGSPPINGVPTILQDEFYIYWVDDRLLVISRLLKTATDINFIETMTIPEGFDTGGNINFYGEFAAMKDGKLYIPWQGTFNSVSNVMKLIVVDLDAWDPAAFTSYDYETGFPLYVPKGFAVTDNGTVIIATATGSTTFTGRYYYATIGSLASWSNSAASFPTDPNHCASSGNIAYFAEIDSQYRNGTPHRKTQLAVVDVSGSFTETVIDLNTKDSNFVGFSQTAFRGAFASDTHLFVAGNNSINNTATGTIEHRYIGRFDLGTLTSASGKFFSELLYNENDFTLKLGHYLNGKIYIGFQAQEQRRSGFAEINENLDPSSMTFWWKGSTPANNNFASPFLLFVGTTQSNDLTFANTEASEPVPSYLAGTLASDFNNGHSVWYKFKAPSTTTYTVTVTSTISGKNNIAIYTGTALGSLSEVTSGGAGSPGATLAFAATADVDYMIAVRLDNGADGFGSAIEVLQSQPGKFTISIS